MSDNSNIGMSEADLVNLEMQLFRADDTCPVPKEFELKAVPLVEVLREDVTKLWAEVLYLQHSIQNPPATPIVRFKRLHPDAVAPTRAHPTDAGYDLTAFSREYNAEHRYWEYGTGIAVEIPEGFVGLLFPRSSISKTNLALANSVGVIDASYRGEVKLRFREAYRGDLTFPNLKVGERCGQLVIMPIFAGDMVEADELSETPRGEGGFGSTNV